MIIFLSINLNFRNERKMVIKLRGCTNIITHIVAANTQTTTLGTDLKLRHSTLLNSHYVKLSIFLNLLILMLTLEMREKT